MQVSRHDYTEYGVWLGPIVPCQCGRGTLPMLWNFPHDPDAKLIHSLHVQWCGSLPELWVVSLTQMMRGDIHSQSSNMTTTHTVLHTEVYLGHLRMFLSATTLLTAVMTASSDLNPDARTYGGPTCGLYESRQTGIGHFPLAQGRPCPETEHS